MILSDQVAPLDKEGLHLLLLLQAHVADQVAAVDLALLLRRCGGHWGVVEHKGDAAVGRGVAEGGVRCRRAGGGGGGKLGGVWEDEEDAAEQTWLHRLSGDMLCSYYAMLQTVAALLARCLQSSSTAQQVSAAAGLSRVILQMKGNWPMVQLESCQPHVPSPLIML